MKKHMEMMKNLTILTQFGLSFITPIIMCLAVCYRLNMKLHVGMWVYIIGFFLGIGSSFTVAYKLYLSVMKHEKQEKRKKTLSFNEHE